MKVLAIFLQKTSTKRHILIKVKGEDYVIHMSNHPKATNNCTSRSEKKLHFAKCSFQMSEPFKTASN